MSTSQAGLVDFIHAITFEIWEQRGVERILDYYASNVEVFALTGVVEGAGAMVDNTHQTLESFPDRLLLAENVIATGDEEQGHSSHRIFSPMTNLGATPWAAATGRSVVVRTVADCLVEQGRITREWLVRDTLCLVQQLGLDAHAIAARMATERNERTRQWLETEILRCVDVQDVAHPLATDCRRVLEAWWSDAGESSLEETHATHAVLWPDSLRVCSGLAAIHAEFDALRDGFPEPKMVIDHVASQPWAGAGEEIAFRFSIAAAHRGTYEGIAATNRDCYLLGVVHCRRIHGKVVAAWLVLDRLGVMAQLS